MTADRPWIDPKRPARPLHRRRVDPLAHRLESTPVHQPVDPLQHRIPSHITRQKPLKRSPCRSGARRITNLPRRSAIPRHLRITPHRPRQGDHGEVSRLYIRREKIELRPENPKYQPIPIGSGDDLRILGKGVAVRRPQASVREEER